MRTTEEGYPSKITETNCDREPIHIIGKSQAHGVMIACDKETYIITQCSENSAEVLGISVKDLLEKPLSILLSEDLYIDLNLRKGDKILLPEVKYKDSAFLVIAHISEESLILDVEPVVENLQPVIYQDQLTRILNELTAAESIEQLCNHAAYLVKKLFRYDRVMLYRFDEEWNGEVIAEEKEQNL